MIKYTFGFPKSSWIETDCVDENDENSSSVLNVTSADDNLQINRSNTQDGETIEYVDVIVEDDSSTNQTVARAQPKYKRKASDRVSDHNDAKKGRIDMKGNALFGSKYFSLVSKSSKGTEAKCMKCGKQLKGYGQSNSNYISHLRIVSIKIV